MDHNGAWEILEDKKFKRQRISYERNDQTREALANCVELLSKADDPARLGDRKYGRYAGTYGYKLTKSLRVIYKICYDTHQILLMIMGDHKKVYGRD